jgi:hypothetical protein
MREAKRLPAKRLKEREFTSFCDEEQIDERDDL